MAKTLDTLEMMDTKSRSKSGNSFEFDSKEHALTNLLAKRIQGLNLSKEEDRDAFRSQFLIGAF